MGIILFGKGNKDKPKSTGVISKVKEKIKSVVSRKATELTKPTIPETVLQGAMLKVGMPPNVAKVGNLSALNRIAPMSPLAATQYAMLNQTPRKVSQTEMRNVTSGGLVSKLRDKISKNPLTSVAVAATGGALVGAAATYIATRKKKKKKKSSGKKKKKKSKSPKRSTRRSTRRKTARRRKGYGSEASYKRKGGKSVKYTKTGQPYIILSNGRARFVKRSKR